MTVDLTEGNPQWSADWIIQIPAEDQDQNSIVIPCYAAKPFLVFQLCGLVMNNPSFVSHWPYISSCLSKRETTNFGL